MKGNTLSSINRQNSMGAGPCQISLDKDSSNLFVASYSGGSVTSYSLRNEDKPETISPPVSHDQHVGSSVHPKRQNKPYAHSIYTSADNKFVCSADLGMVQVIVYELDVEAGSLTPAGSVKTLAGGGARHMDFSPTGDKIFVFNELTISVSQFARDVETGALKLGLISKAI